MAKKSAKSKRPVDLKIKKVVGQYQRTPEQIAEHRAIHERFSRDKPSPEQLIASGEYSKAAPFTEVVVARALAANLRQARQQKRLSLEELSKQTGIRVASLSRLESGKTNPTLRTLMRYAKAVGKELAISLR